MRLQAEEGLPGGAEGRTGGGTWFAPGLRPAFFAEASKAPSSPQGSTPSESPRRRRDRSGRTPFARLGRRDRSRQRRDPYQPGARAPGPRVPRIPEGQRPDPFARPAPQRPRKPLLLRHRPSRRAHRPLPRTRQRPQRAGEALQRPHHRLQSPRPLPQRPSLAVATNPSRAAIDPPSLATRPPVSAIEAHAGAVETGGACRVDFTAPTSQPIPARSPIFAPSGRLIPAWHAMLGKGRARKMCPARTPYAGGDPL